MVFAAIWYSHIREYQIPIFLVFALVNGIRKGELFGIRMRIFARILSRYENVCSVFPFFTKHMYFDKRRLDVSSPSDAFSKHVFKA